MSAKRKAFLGIVTASALSAALGACGGGAGETPASSSIFDSPGTKIKQAFVGKPIPEPDLPDRAPLVMPKATADLPPPGSGQNIAPSDTQQSAATQKDQKKQASAQTKSSCQDQANGDAFTATTNKLGCPVQ